LTGCGAADVDYFYNADGERVRMKVGTASNVRYVNQWYQKEMVGTTVTTSYWFGGMLVATK
jgi:hypothetical protein